MAPPLAAEARQLLLGPEVLLTEGGSPVEGERLASFAFDPQGGPLYVDGSAYHPRWPDLAAAGAAIVQ
eukprot:2905146-Lingulodinium_polyedra.AAC.1